MSSYSCRPDEGSEPGVGWNMAKVICGRVQLSVITRQDNRSYIEASDEGWISSVEWLYYDEPWWFNFIRRGWLMRQSYYIFWQIGIFLKLRKKSSVIDYDLIHHVTFGKYWIPSLLVLLGPPVIFGSVGGAEYTPQGLYGVVSKRVKRTERIKRTIETVITRTPISTYLYKKVKLSYAATVQTEQALKKLGVKSVKLLPQSGISSDELCRLKQISASSKNIAFDADFVACSASRLIGWKGVDISIRGFIQALTDLPSRSLLRVVGVGPEMNRLKAMVKNAGAENNIQFLGRLRGLDDVYHVISKSDCLLHAATCEAFGQVCAESLSLGVPIICWDWSGPGMIVDEKCGIGVPVNSDEPINAFAEAIVEISQWSDSRKCSARDAGVKRITESFLWDAMGTRIMNDYCEIDKMS